MTRWRPIFGARRLLAAGARLGQSGALPIVSADSRNSEGPTCAGAPDLLDSAVNYFGFIPTTMESGPASGST